MARLTRPVFWMRGVFILLIMGGVIFFAWRKPYQTESLPTQSPTAEPDVITYSIERPDIEKPKPLILPKGTKPTDPVRITLPSINAEGDIVKVGIDQGGAIAAPNNIHQAGWFVHSVPPGEKGLSIINGHIDPRTNTAIFEELATLKVGETFQIKLSNGVVQTYAVRDMQTRPIEESASVLFSQLPRVSYQLNLITCAGTYDQTHGLFTHRLIVAAELVP